MKHFQIFLEIHQQVGCSLFSNFFFIAFPPQLCLTLNVRALSGTGRSHDAPHCAELTSVSAALVLESRSRPQQELPRLHEHCWTWLERNNRTAETRCHS